MGADDQLAQQFEANRGLLEGVAYRMLGSRSEADDAVQEAWLRLERTGTEGIENLGGWLRTVVARICLDLLRSRKARREEPMDSGTPDPIASSDDPEQDALLADAVGLALMVVLHRLGPAERVAFVLHDMFDLPFEEVARVVGRSPTATRQLASRARRRVRGAATVPAAELAQQREVVDAYLKAAREGDIDGILAVLDPDVVLRVGKGVPASAGPREFRGAALVVRGAMAGRARYARPAIVDGRVGIVVAPKGRLRLVLVLVIQQGKISAIDLIADPKRLEQMELRVVD